MKLKTSTKLNHLQKHIVKMLGNLKYYICFAEASKQAEKRLKEKPPVIPKGPPSPIHAGHDHKRLSDQGV